MKRSASSSSKTGNVTAAGHLERFLDETNKLAKDPVNLHALKKTPFFKLRPRDEDYDNNNPSMDKMPLENKMLFYNALEQKSEKYFEERVGKVDASEVSFEAPEGHAHTHVEVPASCKALCLAMADEEELSQLGVDYDFAEVRMLLPTFDSLRKRETVDFELSFDETEMAADLAISHALLNRRGKITLLNLGRYKWFEGYIGTRRNKIRNTPNWHLQFSLANFCKEMEGGAALRLKQIRLQARNLFQLVFPLDTRESVFVCVLFHVPGAIPEELSVKRKEGDAFSLQELEKPDLVAKLQMTYLGHAYFTCNCPVVASEIRAGLPV